MITTMVSENWSRITVRDASEDDIPEMTAIKGDWSQAIHRDRLRDARGPGFRYLVVLVKKEIVGFACLVFRRPASWPDASDEQHLPQIVDLQVKESMRGSGYGTACMRAIESLVVKAGHEQLFLCVEPLDNPRAYKLYQRLGYQPLQTGPYQSIWEFQDSDGNVHRGEDQVVDMVKHLKRRPNSVTFTFGLILLTAAFWLGFAVFVAMGAIPSIPVGVIRWGMAILATGVAVVLAGLTYLLWRRVRLAYYGTVALLTIVVVLSITDQVGLPDLLTLLVSLAALVLLLKERAWYLQR
jgi:GNAT superfamily N-acetyltransferase